MTRAAYDGCVTDDEVLARLDRYIVEVVEAYNLCPWAKSARLGGEVQKGVLRGPPTVDAFVAAARELLARPHASVVMIVAPDFTGTPGELRALRAEVAKRVDTAGVAEFHPTADLDLATPARLVRFLRRSPDPMLQFVPLAILDSVRTADRVVIDPVDQLELLKGNFPKLPEADIAEKIAEANHATVMEHRDAIVAKLAELSGSR